MKDVKIILVDPKAELCAALQERFSGLPNVEVVRGRFEQLREFDCMVSAANSFGLMDGGVDAAITQFFGYALRERVQDVAGQRQAEVRYGGDLGFLLSPDTDP